MHRRSASVCNTWPMESLERRAALSAGERIPLPLEGGADGVVDMDEAYYDRTN